MRIARRDFVAGAAAATTVAIVGQGTAFTSDAPRRKRHIITLTDPSELSGAAPGTAHRHKVGGDPSCWQGVGEVRFLSGSLAMKSAAILSASVSVLIAPLSGSTLTTSSSVALCRCPFWASSGGLSDEQGFATPPIRSAATTPHTPNQRW